MAFSEQKMHRMISAVGCHAVKSPAGGAEIGEGFQLLDWKNEVISGQKFDLTTDQIMDLCFDRNDIADKYRQYLSQKDLTAKKPN